MREAPDRIRAAFQSMGWRWPGKRITMLLHPLDMHKSGATLDLPMALAIAMATERIASATTSCVGPRGLESFWTTLSARQGRGGSSEAIYQAFTAIDSRQPCISSN